MTAQGISERQAGRLGRGAHDCGVKDEEEFEAWKTDAALLPELGRRRDREKAGALQIRQTDGPTVAVWASRG
jgi:hypothetical protein